MATRSAKVSMERRASGGLNDNYPSALPGHELTGLEGVPRPPAAEAVVHYSRFAEINSFPDHPGEPISDASEPPIMDAVVEEVRRASHGKKSVTFACLGSCFLHAALVVAALMLAIPSPDDAQQEEGDTLSVVMLGNSDADEKAAGEETKQPPEPEQVTAEAVQPETVQPTDAQPVETQPIQPPEMSEAVQPVESTEPAQPTTEAVQPAASETISTTQPQILATQAPAETTVVQPATSEPVGVQPTETVQAVEPPAEVVTPVAKPAQPAKSVEKPKEIVKKQPVKVEKVKSGSRGEALQDRTRGSAEGTEAARSDKTAQADARRSGEGNAARSNYNGKIQTCIRRAVRGISARGDNTTVMMRFRVDAAGRILSPGIAASSGNSDIDQAVLAALRGVGSCPPIPAELGVSSMSFNIPFVVRR